VPREDVGAILVTDAAARRRKPAVGYQHHRLTGARERWRWSRRWYRPDRPHRARAVALVAGDRARRAHARIARRATRGRRGHLANVQLASGREADDVRKRTAAIDPELQPCAFATRGGMIA